MPGQRRMHNENELRQHPGVWMLIVLNAAVKRLLMHLLLAMPVIRCTT